MIGMSMDNGTGDTNSTYVDGIIIVDIHVY